ncbi:sel1 repeat family protein [Methylobacillus arboreus]|uniref:tetratricopeptide repeat protein n=1 Tax=Methylobacillus arboreus TaxID=755170 RepID=UPI001E50D2B2|nr:tetratricopeptide repeat protein [Methylobacillus arboreus]MCB5190942.1 sel1 repeat family protein [Methylobacillus arboreus]
MSASSALSITPEQLRNISEAELKRRLAGDPQEAVQWIRALAEQDTPDAQVLLGQAYLDGYGLAPDPRQARIWFRKAAEAGDLMGMNMLGRAYDQGWGGPVDHACAAYWFRMAANQGLDWGMYNYGNLLLHGLGVEKDEIQAFDWYNRAAELGHAKSLGVVGRFFEDGWLGEQDQGKAFDYYRRSAEAGDFRGQYNYALMLLERNDARNAEIWMREALNNAHLAFSRTMATNLLQHPYAGLRQIGIEALAKCAQQGNADDAYAYASALLNQADIASRALGRWWLRQAATQGHAQAQQELKRQIYLS